MEKVPDEKCDEKKKYSDTKPCEHDGKDCPAEWHSGPWSEVIFLKYYCNEINFRLYCLILFAIVVFRKMRRWRANKKSSVLTGK